jgi:D-alanyl-D-alanine carboxypeptidase (penicillin-binding protein 5/6)
MVLGFVVAAVAMVAMQLPLQHQLATSRVTLKSSLAGANSPSLAWPTIGGAALDIPALGVVQSWNDKVVPIASLTKMMTAWVVLQQQPLAIGASGPCLVVTPEEVTAYQLEKVAGESSALVVAGEQICEFDLLSGLLVHSAGNYAELLATLVSGSLGSFIAQMNDSAALLGLSNTHYDDVSGFSPLSVSTALDQAKLAVFLMKSPLIQAIVIQPTVTLPVAGVVNSFTPLVGVDNVVGVKSGRTNAAGGCDVLALTFAQGGFTRIIYAVVLGQRGGDLLTPAGQAALTLAESALANRIQVVYAKGDMVGHVGWGAKQVSFGFSHRSVITWWAPRSKPPVTVVMRPISGRIRQGEVVGRLRVRGSSRSIALVARRPLSPPTIWQRLL